MKTNTFLKRTSMMILLALASIFICALFVGPNSYAHADVQNQQAVNEDEGASELERIYSTKADDGVSPAYDEVRGDFLCPNTFYVKDHFNQVERMINGKLFKFTYNYRGYLGEPDYAPGRRAYIQYFYNSNTKDMVFLTFGQPSEKGYQTYSYPFSSADTIFEDNIEYREHGYYCIAQNVKRCYIDPKINALGCYCFQCCQHLELVDVINQEYDACQLGKEEHSTEALFEGCFRKAGCDGRTPITSVDARILKAFDANKIRHFLSEDERDRWASWSKIKFDGVEYEPVH